MTLSSVYDSGIIGYALNGTQNYVSEAVRENEIMNQTESVLEEALTEINSTETLATAVITADNYGDLIEYSANGVTDWEIFYNDGEYVYIITCGYLENSKIPSEAGMTTYGTYGAYWSGSNWSVTDLINAQSRFMYSGLSTYVTTTNDNYYATASLLDTTVWSSFTNGYAEYAIGSPTVEMWVASWNASGYEEIFTTADEIGYGIGWTGSSSASHIYLKYDTNGYADWLYFPYTSQISSCSGYWLSSPSSSSTYDLVGVEYSGYIYDWSYGYTGFALRPVVCLKADTTLEYYDGYGWIITN